MEKLDKLIMKVLFWACSFLMFLMALIITSQVISRYAFRMPLTWSEELGRYIFVWMSFIGMAAAIKLGSHVALDILVKKLTGISQKILILINNCFIFLFGACLTYSGSKLVKLGIGQKSPTLEIPMQYIYIIIPISGVILIYFVLSGTIEMFKRKEELL